jgi:DeoR family transcriptional regulator, aga operon transcriptional repressor
VHRGDRLNFILDRLAEGGVVRIAALAKEMSVSPGTVRRDLQLLEEQKLLSRSHGGAVAQGVLYQLPVRYLANEYTEAKKRIAKEVVNQLSPGMTVGLTGGTTTTEVARALVEIDRLTVVTSALNIAGELVVRPSIKLVVTGGVARSDSYELVGPMAEANLDAVNIDILIMGVDGISASRGACTRQELEAQTTQALMRRSAKVFIVADGSKIGRVAFAKLCDISEIDELVTDTSAEGPDLNALRRAGLKVTLAGA